MFRALLKRLFATRRTALPLRFSPTRFAPGLEALDAREVPAVLAPSVSDAGAADEVRRTAESDATAGKVSFQDFHFTAKAGKVAFQDINFTQQMSKPSPKL